MKKGTVVVVTSSLKILAIHKMAIYTLAGNESAPLDQCKGGGRTGGKQYKTIAGPVALKVSTGLGGFSALGSKDYEASVRQYDKIIDEEAVGGWALLLKYQLTLSKI